MADRQCAAPRTMGVVASLADAERPFQSHSFETWVEPLPQRPLVLLTPRAYKRMLLYVDIAPLEVGWLGTVTAGGDGTFLIEDVFLLEQEVTLTQTELSTDGQSKLALELLSRGEQGFRQVNNLRFWGHSHVRGGTRPSGTDERTLARFGESGHPFFIRGIFNKHGRIEFTICLFDYGMKIWDAPWAVLSPRTGKPMRMHRPLPDGTPRLPRALVPSAALRRTIEREIAAKVKEKE